MATNVRLNPKDLPSLSQDTHREIGRLWRRIAAIERELDASGASGLALDDLSDVDTTGAGSGDVLTYDGTTWEAVAPAGGSGDITSVVAGNGLTGGAASGAATLDVAANADGSITVNANDVQVGVLATDAQHGNRGGGGIHALANTTTAGFMSAAHFDVLDAADFGDVFLFLSGDVTTALYYMSFNQPQGIGTIATNHVNWLAPYNCELVEVVLYLIDTNAGTTVVGAHINENAVAGVTDSETWNADAASTWTLGQAISAGERLAISIDAQFNGGHYSGYARIRRT